MIKIDYGYDNKGNKCNLNELAELHYKELITHNRFISPLVLLSNAKKGRRSKRLEFVRKVSNEKEFHRLVVADLEEIPKIITEYEEFSELFDNNKFNRSIFKWFSFERFRKSKRAYNFVKRLNIKTCPYCNNHFTLLRHNSKKVDCEFDHFYPKQKYPYLSISFYNLIPCCSVCNRAKNETENKDIIHPYYDSFYDKFLFSTDKKTIIDFIIQENRDFETLQIKAIPNRGFEKEFDAHNEIFNIEEIHQEHKDIVFEIYSKAYHYPESRKLELRNLFNKSLFRKEEIDRFVLGNYVLPEEINKRPLSKFMQDIARESGLI